MLLNDLLRRGSRAAAFSFEDTSTNARSKQRRATLGDYPEQPEPEKIDVEP